MIAIIFLLIILLHGITLASAILPVRQNVIKLIFGFVIGSLLCISGIYWISCLTRSLDISLFLFFVVSTALFFSFFTNYKKTVLSLKKIRKTEMLLFFLLFLFSYWLFAKSFSYDSIHGSFLIASNVYLDFGAHIPFIRSFSLGNNFPGEVPFFGNSGLLYYFLFDFYAGVIERLGLRIDIAFNIISSLSFSCLLIMIYELALLIFKNKKIGVLSIIFFLFSSNLSFLTFFQKYGFHLSTIAHWWHNNFYFEGQSTFLNKTIQVSGFWNLNPYVNQRHLVFGILFFLIFLYLWILFQQNKKKIHPSIIYVLGISLGLLAMWHTMIFIAVFMVSIPMLFVYPFIRKQLLITLVIATSIALPQLFLIKLHSANTIVLKPGFLLENMLTLKNEFIFWLVNLGLGLVVIPIGFFLANKEQKKFFLIFLPLFLIPNLVHLSSRFTFDDHKYFNTWIIGMNMFSALLCIRLLQKSFLSKLTGLILVVFLTLSGFISIMVIKNDVYAVITDYPKNAFLSWAKIHIPSNQIILTNGEIYDPVTLIGKKTFIGRVQYIYVYGGDASKRLAQQDMVLHPQSYTDIIQIAKQNNIRYAVFYKNNFAKNEKEFNEKFYNEHFLKLYEDTNGVVYKI